MKLPQPLEALTPRTIDEISAAARCAQANVVTLRVLAERRTPGLVLSDIRTPPPGAIRRRRDLLLRPKTIRSYAPDELIIRLRQVWGEFCALCWLFPHVDPQAPLDLDALPPGQTVRCIGDARDKLREVQTHLWRLLHEQRRRHDPAARGDPSFQRDEEIAVTQRLLVFGLPLASATDSQVFQAACEYAGMLAALRWALDDRWEWEGPGIMRVDGSPGASSADP